MRWSRIPVVFVSLLLPVAAQHGSSTTVNPNNTPQDAYEGARVYRGKCAGCHGPDGAGTGAGPALNSGAFKRGGSDEALFQTITNGVAGTAMPAFPQNTLEVWQTITYLRSLSVARRAGKLPGDPKAGSALFAQNCAGCHLAGAAPDLAGIADRQSLAELRASVLRPGESVSSSYWSVRATTTAGRTISGTRLNEDTHSVQLRDAAGALISLRKADLASLDIVRTSPMPAFEGKLAPKQLDDLLSYLAQIPGGSR